MAEKIGSVEKKLQKLQKLNNCDEKLIKKAMLKFSAMDGWMGGWMDGWV